MICELIIGLACWYEHTTTSIDAHLDPFQKRFFAAQENGWNRTPEWYLVTVGGASILAQRRDITRSHYDMEMSPALCEALGLDFGYNSAGVPYGEWPVKARRWHPGASRGRYLLYY